MQPETHKRKNSNQGHQTPSVFHTHSKHKHSRAPFPHTVGALFSRAAPHNIVIEFVGALPKGQQAALGVCQVHPGCNHRRLIAAKRAHGARHPHSTIAPTSPPTHSTQSWACPGALGQSWARQGQGVHEQHEKTTKEHDLHNHCGTGISSPHMVARKPRQKNCNK